MDFLDLPAVSRAEGAIRLPGSKSITLRALLLAALASGDTRLEGVLESEDTQVMVDALRALGVDCKSSGSGVYQVKGSAGVFPVKQAGISAGISGVSARTLIAALAFSGGDYIVDGGPRMRERPIRDLVDALKLIGADIRYTAADGFIPLRIAAGNIQVAEPICVRGDASSQFLTGLLQALPLCGRPAVVKVMGTLISAPYIEITLNLMDRFGVSVSRQDWTEFRVPGGQHYASPGVMQIEGDASGASYFLAAGAIGGGRVKVEGVGASSIQGDVRFVDALERMGALIESGDQWLAASSSGSLRGIDLDCVAIPDAAMTLAVVALFADGPTTLRGISSWRVKETDRIAAMANELRKVGAVVQDGLDWLRVTPPAMLHTATIDTYDDHRMAMCFSLVTLGGVPIRINDPGCVRKTYPDYFAEFSGITA